MARVPMLCECGADDCRELVPVTLDEYAHVRESGLALLAAGH